MTGAAGWRISSYISDHSGNCVEVGAAAPAIAERDSKDPAGPMLAFPVGIWTAFTGADQGRAAGPARTPP